MTRLLRSGATQAEERCRVGDISVVFLREVLPINRTDLVERDVLRITTERVERVSVVLVNGVTSARVLPISSTQMLVEIPSSVLGGAITSVAALSARPRTTNNSVISFRLLRETTPTYGLQRLVQRFLLHLLSTAGSDVFAPDQGGGMLALIDNILRGHEQNMRGGVQRCISKTSQELRRIEARNMSLTADERLGDAKLGGIQTDEQTGTIAVQIHLSALSGQVAVSNMFL